MAKNSPVTLRYLSVNAIAIVAPCNPFRMESNSMLEIVAIVISEIMAGDALGISAAARLFPAHKGHSPTTNPAAV